MTYLFLENSNVVLLENGTPNLIDGVQQISFDAPTSSERSAILMVLSGAGLLQDGGAQTDGFGNGNTGASAITYPETHYYSFISISVTSIANAITNPLASNRGDVELSRVGLSTGTELLGVALTSTTSQTSATINHGGGTTNPIEPCIVRRFGVGPEISGVAPTIKGITTSTATGSNPLVIQLPASASVGDRIIVILTSAAATSTSLPLGYSLFGSQVFGSLTQEVITRIL